MGYVLSQGIKTVKCFLLFRFFLEKALDKKVIKKVM